MHCVRFATSQKISQMGNKFDKEDAPPRCTDITVGARVFGQTSEAQYRTAVIESETREMWRLKYDHNNRNSFDKSDPKAIVLDVVPPRSALTEGTEVIAWWPNDVKYFKGRVEKTSEDNYLILYDDQKGKQWVAVHYLRILGPCPNEESTTE